MRDDPVFGGLSRPDNINPAWTKLGFKFGDRGAHTSRTIMFEELSALFKVCPPDTSRSAYSTCIVEDNCLGKRTLSTRKLTLQRLSELYAIEPDVPLFRLLRHFWDASETGHAQLALLAALSRDPLLRATAPVILGMTAGEEIARQRVTDALRRTVDGRLNDDILDKVVRNTGSSWTQSGHLIGRGRKKRLLVQPTATSTAFALLLGFLLGARGRNLFETLFCRVLDRDVNELTYLTMDAKQLGLLDLKSSGGLMTVSFDAIISPQERKLAYGAN